MMKYYLWILGCAMNYSDAERIASVFDAAGYMATASEKDADVVVTVACSVRQTAIDRIYGKAKGWQKRKRKNPRFRTVLSGCVLPDDKKKLADSFDLIFDVAEIGNLENFLKLEPKKLNANSETQISDYERDYLSIVPKYESSFRAYVPIMTGCDNFCSYCAVPYTRGREKSRTEEDVVAEVRDLVSRGYKEITLLGQNVNSFGKVSLKGLSSSEGSALLEEKFVNLLRKIDKIAGDYRVYFYSNHPKDFSDELIEILSGLKHFPHYIHLPLQSGNDEILKRMNRHYTAKKYLALVKKIRASLPDVVLTTDIIVGFPGEGEKEFRDTVEIVKKVGFEMIFIGQYSPRAGTVSTKFVDNVSRTTKKERDRILTDTLAKNLEVINKRFVGKTVKVLIDEEKQGKCYGRTEGYKVVEIKTDQPLVVGQFYDVKITKSSAWKLFGSVL